MSQVERNSKVQKLIEQQKFNREEISGMTDSQIEYYHWLYFNDSVYDYM
ncbi:BH0509 family protein [Peribacillus asahii]|uniref:BH0509 family protein n=1 Tax=Peribacillus asahii TaxID=228899 RepID=A0A398BF43_9BACI|nr:BH0509 family protein [Peribacillus asahii]RID88417.1 BH0509 family protein [Peribacillus asahii]